MARIYFIMETNNLYSKIYKLRKRNMRKMLLKVKKYKTREISKEDILESFQGWNAYAKWVNSYRLRKEIVKKIYVKFQF